MYNYLPINSTHVKVSMSPHFKKRLVEEANKAGVGFSTYIKYVLLEKWNMEQLAGITQEKVNKNKSKNFWSYWRENKGPIVPDSSRTDQDLMNDIEDKVFN